jgi:hypothetical protein
LKYYFHVNSNNTKEICKTLFGEKSMVQVYPLKRLVFLILLAFVSILLAQAVRWPILACRS